MIHTHLEEDRVATEELQLVHLLLTEGHDRVVIVDRFFDHEAVGLRLRVEDGRRQLLAFASITRETKRGIFTQTYWIIQGRATGRMYLGWVDFDFGSSTVWPRFGRGEWHGIGHCIGAREMECRGL